MALAALPAPLLAAGEEEVFEKAYSMEGITKVTVENVNGSIEATAWAKPYFKVKAIKRAEGGRAEETLKLTEIRVRKVGDEIRIETVNPKRQRLFGFLDFGSPNAHVDYVLQIPGPTTVHFETCNGRVVANGFSGTLSGDAVNGSIELADIEGQPARRPSTDRSAWPSRVRSRRAASRRSTARSTSRSRRRPP